MFDKLYEKLPGCGEHISMVWAALKEANSNKLPLAKIWIEGTTTGFLSVAISLYLFSQLI